MDKNIELGHLPQDDSNSQTADNANVNNDPATQEKKTDEIELIPEEHKCHKCDVQFSEFNLLCKHFFDAHVEFVIGQFCDVCGQILKHKMDVVEHRIKCRSEVHEEAETDANREDLSVPKDDIDNSLSGSPTDCLRKLSQVRREQEVIIGDDGIELHDTPLSTAIFIRGATHPNELMIVWTEKNLEEDVLLSIVHNAKNAILVVKELNIEKLTDTQINYSKQGLSINFVTAAENGFGTSWTLILFGGNSPADMKNRLFKNVAEVEKFLGDYAAGRGMPLINMIRYEQTGIYPTLVKALIGKKLAFDYKGFI